MKTKYGEISNEMFNNYLNRLISEFFKILCMYEEKGKTLHKYIQSFQFELSGSKNVIECFNENPSFVVLLTTLESISKDVCTEKFENHQLIKSEIFKCISLINKIKKTTLESGDSVE